MRFCLVSVCILLACSSGNGRGDEPLTAPGGFYTEGKYIYDADGKKHIFRGVNRPGYEDKLHGDFRQHKNEFPEMARWGANVVRIPINQHWWLTDEKGYRAKIAQVIDWTLDSGMTAIADLHRSTSGGRVVDLHMADEESLDECFTACLPEWNYDQKKVLQQEWDGLCYSAAMRWITATKDSAWQVVHGTVYSGELEKRIEHAWCERGDVIVDLAMHPEVRVIDRHTYYRTIQPEISKVYSAEDALVLSIRNGHHGPWDESEQLKE